MKWDEKIILALVIIAVGAVLLMLTWNIATIQAIGDVMAWQSIKNGKPDADLVDLTSIAQINTANYTLAQVFLSGLSLIISVGGFFFLYISLNQTRKSLADNERFGEAQTDAYVIPHDVDWVNGNEIHMLVKNFGTTPALDVQYTTIIAIKGSGSNANTPEFNRKTQQGPYYAGCIAPNDDLITIIPTPEILGITQELLVDERPENRIAIAIKLDVIYSTINKKTYSSEFEYYYDANHYEKFVTSGGLLPVHKPVS